MEGNAFLQIRFSPAVAHNLIGNPTVSPTELMPGLPAILEAKETCDFEGVVTWVLGLSSEVDFRALSIANQIIIVDVQYP